jgi:hypothetical protein
MGLGRLPYNGPLCSTRVQRGQWRAMDRTRRLLVVTVNASGNRPPELVLIRALAQRGHTVGVP